MLTTILPNYYKFIYLTAVGFLVTLYLANFHYRKNLQTAEEYASHRHLLTVTATFTYKKELRWVWYYISILCCMCYGAFGPAYYKAYFTSIRFITSLKDNRLVSNLALRILTVTAVTWSVLLSMIVFLIQGEYPARDAEIQPWIWINHF